MAVDPLFPVADAGVVDAAVVIGSGTVSPRFGTLLEEALGEALRVAVAWPVELWADQSMTRVPATPRTSVAETAPGISLRRGTLR